jgi:hypothetical protein
VLKRSGHRFAAQGCGDKDCSKNWWQGYSEVTRIAQGIGGKDCSEVKVLRVVARIAQRIGDKGCSKNW